DAMLVRDSMAISFMNSAIRKGIKVPDQLQVIGFQNTRYALLANPKLTCVEIPIYEIGNQAMEVLTKLMKEGLTVDSDNPHLLVDYKIIWRETTRN
ncbi:MAG TPA: substrate-binding domain-containing protein, partial [Bacilli bacterium]|nr:substrate-binding domain-containing protein [Bacilli bacterium]